MIAAQRSLWWSTVALATAAACQPSAPVLPLASLPDRQLLVFVGDGGSLVAQLQFDAGAQCYSLDPSSSATIDTLPAEVVSLGQAYMDFNGDPACYFPQFEVPPPSPADPITEVSVSDPATTAAATFENLEAHRTAVLDMGGAISSGQWLALSLTPTSDSLDPDSTAVAWLPDDGTGPYPVASGGGLGLSEGHLAFQLPQGLDPGPGNLAITLSGTARVLECEGVRACSAPFSVSVFLPVTVD